MGVQRFLARAPPGWRVQSPRTFIRLLEPSSTPALVHPLPHQGTVPQIPADDSEVFESVAAKQPLPRHIGTVPFIRLVIHSVVLTDQASNWVEQVRYAEQP